MKIEYPPKAIPLFSSWFNYLYLALYGGRGSGKSETVARWVIGRCLNEKVKVLCVRESQNSMAESVHALLSGIIKLYELDNHFDVQRDKIICIPTGSTIIFKGLRQEAGHIRSMYDVDIVWIEEGQYVGRAGFVSLDDTIRKDGSIIIMVLNPRYADDPLYHDFIATNRSDTLKINMNIMDNPFATDVQKAKARRMMENDYEQYCHVYLGELKEASDSLIFKGKYEIREFDTPEDVIFYHGADWGFSQDPNAVVRSWIDDSKYNLMVDYAPFGYHTELEDLPELFLQVPEIKYREVRADNARPETISFMNRKGFNVVPAAKGKGSVEDGIERLKGFNKIVIHPRCIDLIDEFRNYSYKIDQRTDKITKQIRDDYNHGIDALRYATEGINHNSNDKNISDIADIF